MTPLRPTNIRIDTELLEGMQKIADEAALPAAERLALKVIASYGALSSEDGFYKATSDFAQEHFGNADAMDRLHAVIEAVRTYMPEDVGRSLCSEIDSAANDLEFSRWEAD